MREAVQRMKLVVSVCLAALASGAAAQTPPTATFSKLTVNWLPELARAAPETLRIFAGKGEKIEVRFQIHSNENSADITLFPDAPVTMTNSEEKSQCEINAGGWAREVVYLSSDERTLLLGRFNDAATNSSAYDLQAVKAAGGTAGGLTLVSYDIGACREIKRIDVSENPWDIGSDAIRIGENCNADGIENSATVIKVNLREFLAP